MITLGCRDFDGDILPYPIQPNSGGAGGSEPVPRNAAGEAGANAAGQGGAGGTSGSSNLPIGGGGSGGDSSEPVEDACDPSGVRNADFAQSIGIVQVDGAPCVGALVSPRHVVMSWDCHRGPVQSFRVATAAGSFVDYPIKSILHRAVHVLRNGTWQLVTDPHWVAIELGANVREAAPISLTLSQPQEQEACRVVWFGDQAQPSTPKRTEGEATITKTIKLETGVRFDVSATLPARKTTGAALICRGGLAGLSNLENGSFNHGSLIWKNYVMGLLANWYPSAFSLHSSAKGLDLYARKSDHAVHTRRRSADTWSNWQSLGGNMATTPVAVGETQPELFALGTDAQIWNAILKPDGSLERWEELGGRMLSPPLVLPEGTEKLHLFAVSRTGQACYRQRVLGVWNKWTSLGGAFDRSITGAISGTTLHLASIGSDAVPYYKSWALRSPRCTPRDICTVTPEPGGWVPLGTYLAERLAGQPNAEGFDLTMLGPSGRVWNKKWNSEGPGDWLHVASNMQLPKVLQEADGSLRFVSLYSNGLPVYGQAPKGAVQPVQWIPKFEGTPANLYRGVPTAALLGEGRVAAAYFVEPDFALAFLSGKPEDGGQDAGMQVEVMRDAFLP